MPRDLIASLRGSASPLVAALAALAVDKAAGAGAGAGASPAGPGSGGSAAGGRPQRRGASKPTVAGDFARSMARLTATLGAADCSYIRCVKPNAAMRAGYSLSHSLAN